MKFLFTLVALLFSFSCISQSLTDSLLVHYMCAGDATDVSGNNFNGEAYAFSTEDSFGTEGQALFFNGVNAYIDFPDEEALKPTFPMSFAFWMKLDDLAPENTVLFTTDFAQNNHSGVWMNVSISGYLNLSFGNAEGYVSSSGRNTKTGTTQINTDQWYWVVGIVHGPNDMEIYLDCIHEGGEYNGTATTLGYTDNPGSIGRKDAHEDEPAFYLNGSFDDFRYWNRALDPDEVFELCILSTTSLDEKETSSSSISVFPNPVGDVLNLEKNNEVLIEQVVIHNSMGELVHSQGFEVSISLDHLSAGVYYVKAFGQDGVVLETIRFVKM